MEQEDTSPCSQDLATCPYPEPDRFILPQSYSLKIYFNIILLSTPSFPSGLHPSIHQVPLPKECMYGSCPSLMLHVPHISFFFNWPTDCYLAKRTSHASSRIAVSSIPLPSLTSIFSVSGIVPNDLRTSDTYIPWWESYHGEKLLTIRINTLRTTYCRLSTTFYLMYS